MKKLILLIGAIIIVGATVGIYFATKNSRSSSSTTSSSPTGSSSNSTQSSGNLITDACTIFTLEDAKQVLGSAAEKGTNTSAGNVSTSDLAVSTCTYLVKASTQNATTVQSQPTASILVRSSKSTMGTASNKSQFTTLPVGAETVSGYGDSAFWNPTFGQLNVLKHNNWVILSNGTLKITDRKLDDAKKLADVIVPKL